MQIDRRVIKTRTALYDALVTLILRKGFDAITVEDLLEEANVGRSTFYSHFTSKEDLLTSSFERLRTELVQAHGSAAPPEGEIPSWSLALFGHVAQYKGIYFALAGIQAGAVLMTALRGAIAEFAREVLPPMKGIPKELASYHVAATAVTVMTWWLDRRRDLSPREVDGLFRTLITTGIGLG